MRQTSGTSGKESGRPARATRPGGTKKQGGTGAATAAGGGPPGSDQLLALQRLAGNQAIAGVLRDPPRGGAAVVQREPAPAGATRRSRGGIAAELRPEDGGHVGDFFGVVEQIAALPLSRAADQSDIGSALLGMLELRLVGVRNLTRREGPNPALPDADDLGAQVANQWDRLRPDLDAVGDWAAAQGFEAGVVTAYRRSVQRIGDQFLQWYSTRVIQEGAAAVDVGDPEAAYNQQLAAMLRDAAAQVLKVHGTPIDADKVRGKLLSQGSSAAKATGEVITGSSGIDPDPAGIETMRQREHVRFKPPSTGKALAKLPLEVAATGLSILAKAQTYEAQIAGMKEAGLLKATATALDLTKFAVEATQSVLSIPVRAMVALGVESGSRLQSFLGQLKATSVTELKTLGRALGYVTSIMGLAASTLQLIDAINSGDQRAIVEASGGVASSTASFGLFLTGAGAGVSMAVGAVIMMWTETIIALGQLGAVLREIDLEAKGERVRRMVDDAAAAAGTGRRMAAAWEEAQRRKAAEMDAPASTEGRSVAVLEAVAVRLVEDPLLGQLNQVRAQLGTFAHDEDVDANVRQALTEHLALLSSSFGRVEAYPPTITELCRILFADVDGVTRSIAKRAGHLPGRETQPTRR